MIVKKLMSIIKRKKAVFLLSGKHEYWSGEIPVSGIETDGDKGYKIFHTFEREKKDGCVGFCLVDYNDHGQIHIYQESGQENLRILEVSKDLETGVYKIIAVDKKVCSEDYNPNFDNLNFLQENNAQTFFMIMI